MTEYPLVHSSPASPRGTKCPSRSTILTSRCGCILPDRRHTKLQWIVTAALKAHRTGFGHAVGDRYLAHVHLRRDFLHDLDRARRPGHDAAPKRAQIEAR